MSRVWIVEVRAPNRTWLPCCGLCARTRANARRYAQNERDYGKRRGYGQKFRVRAYVREKEAGR